MSATPYVSKAPKPDQFVYYLLGADHKPRYVGRSSDVARRIREHSYHASHPENPIHTHKSTWFFDVRSVSMVGPLPYARAVALERQQIEVINPRGNIVHTRRHTWIAANRAQVSA